MTAAIKDLNLKGKVAVVTGGGGVICSTMARALAAHGVKTAILDLNLEAAEKVAAEIKAESGVESLGFSANVLDRASLEAAKKDINQKLGKIDYLVNGAGGNAASATSKVEKMKDGDALEDTFFGLQLEGFDKTFDLNFKGTLLPTLVFAADMVENKFGGIVNISSMNSYRPLTRIPAYSASKAAINNFPNGWPCTLPTPAFASTPLLPAFCSPTRTAFCW